MDDRKLGFTLLEILVVMIILGVLISVALPQLFRNIENTRASEALASIGVIKRAIEACAMSVNNDFTSCSDYVAIGTDDPSYSATSNAAAHFSYTFTTAANTFEVLAQRNTIDSGNAADTIRLTRASNGMITRSGTGAFTNIQ